MSNTTIDPKNITDFNRDTDQLQSFWLFCMFVAGKNSDYASRCLAKLINTAKHEKSGGIFNHFKLIGEVGIHNALVASKVGQYTRLKKGIMQSLDLDLTTCTLEDLLELHGVGNKTARFFLLHTRERCDYAVLDTHILTWMRDHGVEEAPKNTPTNVKLYEQLENKYRIMSRLYYPHLSNAKIDLLIWTKQSGRLDDDLNLRRARLNYED
jgi:thermostable 8-oxoguanine DNA glycosylase